MGTQVCSDSEIYSQKTPIIYLIIQFTSAYCPGNSMNCMTRRKLRWSSRRNVCRVVREVVNLKAAVIKVGMCYSYVNWSFIKRKFQTISSSRLALKMRKSLLEEKVFCARNLHKQCTAVWPLNRRSSVLLILLPHRIRQKHTARLLTCAGPVQ